MLEKAGFGAVSPGADPMAEQKILTKKQVRAEIAYNYVKTLVNTKNEKDYRQLARSFPALVHGCGLVQAVAFVRAKEGEAGEIYLKHLSMVMPLENGTSLDAKSRSAPLLEYQQITRDATDSATWLKRYAEALLKDDSAIKEK